MISFLSFLLIILHQIQAKNQLLIVSFDGFQAAKLNKLVNEFPESAFNELINTGVRAQYMQPSFPSLTFPNHVTLVTGLNIESHGIVGNTFYDPYYDARVNLIGGPNSLEERWWNKSEPVWVTARKKGLKTASFFWTGSEVLRRNPDVWMTYNNDFPEELRIDEVVNWINKLKIDLSFLYFNEPDSTGHKYGPESPEYFDKIKNADRLLRKLIEMLKEIDIFNKVDIIVLSDHGMATMYDPSLILLTDYIDINWINETRSVYGATANIYPYPGNEKKVYESLKKIRNANVYYKEEMPEEFYYSNSDRIAPLVAIADEGYVFNSVVPSNPYKGNHGFNHTLESIRTIFIAHGPSFNTGRVLLPFRNVNVYSLICNLIGIDSRPNNGTIQPFKDALVKFNSSPSGSLMNNKFLASMTVLALVFFK